MKGDSIYMMRALNLARKGLGRTAPNPPVGAVVVKNGRVVGEGFHPKAGLAHAEVFALQAAGEEAKGATLYVTLEPCPMCAGALVNARVSRVVFGAEDPKGGALVSQFAIGTDGRLNHRFHFEGGLLRGESLAILQAFFRRLRAAGER